VSAREGLLVEAQAAVAAGDWAGARRALEAALARVDRVERIRRAYDPDGLFEAAAQRP
jgi:hypothetical protein